MNDTPIWRRIIESRWFIIGGVIILILLVFAYTRAWYQEYQIRVEISRLEAEADRLEAKKIQITEQLNFVKSSSYIEQKARTELNLVKPGEHMIVLDKPMGKSLDLNSSDMVQYTPKTNVQKWLNYFIH